MRMCVTKWWMSIQHIQCTQRQQHLMWFHYIHIFWLSQILWTRMKNFSFDEMLWTHRERQRSRITTNFRLSLIEPMIKRLIAMKLLMCFSYTMLIRCSLFLSRQFVAFLINVYLIQRCGTWDQLKSIRWTKKMDLVIKTPHTQQYDNNKQQTTNDRIKKQNKKNEQWNTILFCCRYCRLRLDIS